MKNVHFTIFLPSGINFGQSVIDKVHEIGTKNNCCIEFSNRSNFAATGSIMSLVAFANETGFNQIRLICKIVN